MCFFWKSVKNSWTYFYEIQYFLNAAMESKIEGCVTFFLSVSLVVV